jgi:hypothetical protein
MIQSVKTNTPPPVQPQPAISAKEKIPNLAKNRQYISWSEREEKIIIDIVGDDCEKSRPDIVTQLLREFGLNGKYRYAVLGKVRRMEEQERIGFKRKYRKEIRDSDTESAEAGAAETGAVPAVQVVQDQVCVNTN